MSPRALLLTGYIGLLILMSCVSSYLYTKISYMQTHGVPAVARLVSYFETGAGRGGASAVYGRLEFGVDGRNIQTNVPIADTASSADADFVAATSTGQVPIVYDPAHPTRVVYNRNNELSQRRPLILSLVIFIGGAFVFSAIFIPCIVAVWRL